jgi:quercetin dioxygenase-like cupin family protein
MSSGTSDPADALAATLKRTETLGRRGSSIPGRDIVQIRTEIPAGVSSGWHTHPGEEVGYIVAGRKPPPDRSPVRAAAMP